MLLHELGEKCISIVLATQSCEDGCQTELRQWCRPRWQLKVRGRQMVLKSWVLGIFNVKATEIPKGGERGHVEKEEHCEHIE